MVVTPKAPLPNRFGQPEKPNRTKTILFWIFVVVAIVAIAWMIKGSPRQGTLHCASTGSEAWSSFGRCKVD